MSTAAPGAVRESFVPVDGAQLFVREVGRGPPILVIHGGPDFDHTYLLPDLDRLADSYRLIYYDQRALGRSRGELRLDEITIERYVEDLDAVRAYLGLDPVAILGHSWGGFVAMEYALHHPAHVARMILLNTTPASNDDLRLTRDRRHAMWGADRAKLEAIASSAGYREADPATVSSYYRIDYGHTFARAEDADRLQLRWSRENIVKGRAIEDHLAEGLLWREGFTLLPQLRSLPTPTLVLHGELDFVPVEAAARIASAMPNARLVTIPGAGHFSYIDAPGRVHAEIDALFAASR